MSISFYDWMINNESRFTKKKKNQKRQAKSNDQKIIHLRTNEAEKSLDSFTNQDKIFDNGFSKEDFLKLTKNAQMFKEGDGRNGMIGIEEVMTILDSNTIEYDNLQIPQKIHKALMHFLLVQIALSDNRDVGKIPKLLWEEGGLGLGDDGIYRTERIAFWKPSTHLKVIITHVLNAHGTISLVAIFSEGGQIVHTEDLTNMMEGMGMRDFVWWLKQGYQFDMVDPGTGTNPNRPEFQTHNPLLKGKKITKSFDNLARTLWVNKEDFTIQIVNSPRLGPLVDIGSPENSIPLTLAIQQLPYENELDTTGNLPVYNLQSQVSLDYPVLISGTSRMSNVDIQRHLDPNNQLSAHHLGSGSIPYGMTLDPEFYKLWLSGDVEIDTHYEAKYQFNKDVTMNQIIQHDYIHRIGKLNDLQSRAINRIRGMKGTYFGEQRFATWDVEDWIQTVIPASGQRNLALTTGDGFVRPASYYNSIYMIAYALDKFYNPKLADVYMRSHLTPLSYFDYDPVPVWSDIAEDLYYNWRNIQGKIGFLEWFGGKSDMWLFFDHPADLNWVNDFVNGLELIANLNIDGITNIYYEFRSWETMSSHIHKLQYALINLAEMISGSPNTNLFSTYKLSKFTAGKSHITLNLLVLINTFAHVLVDPLYSIDINLPIHRVTSEFVQSTAPSFYNDFDNVNGWSYESPLFLDEFNGKPFFGAFGEISSMPIRMGLGSGTGILRDVSFIKNNEQRYLTSLKNNPLGVNLRPHIEYVWGDERIGNLNLPGGLILQHGARGNRHNQFIDFVREDYGGVVTVDEIFGFNNPHYVYKKYSASQVWILNGHPVIYRPGLSITANRIWQNFGSDSAIRIAPFFLNHQQDVQYEQIIGHILDVSIYSNPNNPLLRHDVLFGMRKPQNMIDWGIYNFFNTEEQAEEWVEKMQLQFGIHVDQNTFEFDYIINSPGIVLPPAANLPTSLASYYTALTAVDPAYDSQLDPFSSNFNSLLILSDRLDLRNNYKYRWWIAYINHFAGLNTGSNLNLVMMYLHQSKP